MRRSHASIAAPARLSRRTRPGSPDRSRSRAVAVYVADTIDHSVLVLDPKHPRDEPESLPMPLNPYAVTPGAGHVWVSGLARNTLTRIDF